MTDGSKKTVVVLDTGDVQGRRLLSDIAIGSGFECAQSVSVDDFTKRIGAHAGAVGLIAYEALWPDPKTTLETMRLHLPVGTRLVVLYEENARGIKLGQRLWDVGILDFFVPRSESPSKLQTILRQAFFDSYMETRVVGKLAALKNDDRNFDLHGHFGLGRVLLTARSLDDIWRHLSMQIPKLIDLAVLTVLIATDDDIKIHVFPYSSFEHQTFWALEQDICRAAEPFHYQPLRVDETLYNDAFLGDRKANASRKLSHAEPIPMVANGKLIGCVGLAYFESEDPAKEHDDKLKADAVQITLAFNLGPSLANIRLLQELEAGSRTDELTGAQNRKNMKADIQREITRSQRYGTPFCAVIADIDHFKKFNDTFGHLQGDLVLKEFAEFLSSQIRNSDRLYRYGGEEFLLLLADNEAAHAALTMERIRAALQAHPLASIADPHTFRLTFSAGIASYPECGAETTADQLIDYADRALYRAKHAGRNRVCVHEKNESSDPAQYKDLRRTARVECKLKVRFSELAEYSPRIFEETAVDISAGGLRIQDSEGRLVKNKYLLVYVAEQTDPLLCRVAWTKDNPASTHGRMAGLEFVKDLPATSKNIDVNCYPRALVLSENAVIVERTFRVLQAAKFHASVFNGEEVNGADFFNQYALIVIGESSLRQQIGQQLQELRENDAIKAHLIFVNEGHDRTAAIQQIQTQEIEHFVGNDDAALETLFAGLNKLLGGEIFGIKKYLMWGADSRNWHVKTADEKERAIDEIRDYALSVKCHPRIADLLVSAVDEMLINAMSVGSNDNLSPASVECGSDGRLLIVSVADEKGSIQSQDLFRSLGRALSTIENGLSLNEGRKSASLGFQIMLTTLSQLSINVNPGKCTEVIGIIDLRKSLKEYRSTVSSFHLFSQDKAIF